MKTVKFFFALETTGLDPRRHGIHRIAGIIEVDGTVTDRFDFRVQPHPRALIDQDALAVAGVTQDEIMGYPMMGKVSIAVIEILKKHIDPFDRQSKAWLVSYNGASFGEAFLKTWFIQNGNLHFHSWFWPSCLDPMILASQYFMEKKTTLLNFSLKSVAKSLNVPFKEFELRDTRYRVGVMREVYNIVTGVQIDDLLI
jgi:DNA polymerase III subunit epsilon